MEKYEHFNHFNYKTIERSEEEIINAINANGKDGWRVVNISYSDSPNSLCQILFEKVIE